MNKTWSEKLVDLKDSGMTYVEIAAACNAPTSTIGSLVAEKAVSPRYELAVRIDALHALRTSAKSKTKAA